MSRILFPFCPFSSDAPLIKEVFTTSFCGSIRIFSAMTVLFLLSVTVTEYFPGDKDEIFGLFEPLLHFIENGFLPPTKFRDKAPFLSPKHAISLSVLTINVNSGTISSSSKEVTVSH